MNLKYFFIPMGITMALGLVVIALGAGYLAYPFANPAPAPEVIQLPPQVIEVPVQPDIDIDVLVREIMAAMPTPAPAQPVIQPVVLPVVSPTPVPVSEPEEPEYKCTDAAAIVVNTPYFKTWKPTVQAELVVYNTGNCTWDANSRYVAPFSTWIPVELLPGGFATVQVTISTTPGVSVITPYVVGEFNESLMPQAMAAPVEYKMDYEDPVSSVPAGSIVINYPTQDWEGLQLPEWKVYPGMPGWFFLEGTGYCYGGG